jgi:uncharacterized protein
VTVYAGDPAQNVAEEDCMHRSPRSITAAILVLALSLLCGRPAVAQAPAPEALAAARELVAASHAADNFKLLLPLLMQQLKPAIVQNRADVARDYDAMVPQLIEGMNKRTDAFVEGIATIYARTFTVDELRQVTAFYLGPVGQKLVEKMPTIAQESAAMGQRFGQEIAGELRDRMIEELRKRGHNI